LPGGFDQPIKDHFGGEASDWCGVPWVDEGIRSVLVDRLHKSVCESHRKIKVCHFMRLQFQRDKIQNVGMVDSQDTHIGAPPGAALFDDIGG
jgi:hypothetical protein